MPSFRRDLFPNLPEGFRGDLHHVFGFLGQRYSLANVTVSPGYTGGSSGINSPAVIHHVLALAGSATHGDTPASLLALIANGTTWTLQLVDAALPIMSWAITSIPDPNFPSR